MTYTKKKKLQTGTGGDVWGPDMPQEIPIKTLSTGAKVNTMTGKVISPTGEVSALQDAIAQAQNKDVGIIQYGGKAGAGKPIGREISQESQEYLKLMSQIPTEQTQEQIAQINAQKAAGLDWGAALQEAGAKTAATAVGSAAVTAATGGAALPVAVIATVGHFGINLYNALKSNAQQDIMADYTSYTDSLMNVKSIIANAGRDPIDALQLYQIELAKIDAAERRLKMTAEKDWLSTSKKQLVKIQDFNSYQREQTRQMLFAAIANPNVIQNFEVPADLTNIEATQ